jgi:hypothetical protein
MMRNIAGPPVFRNRQTNKTKNAESRLVESALA